MLGNRQSGDVILIRVFFCCCKSHFLHIGINLQREKWHWFLSAARSTSYKVLCLCQHQLCLFYTTVHLSSPVINHLHTQQRVAEENFHINFLWIHLAESGFVPF